MPTIEELLAAIRERREVGPRRPTWKVLHDLADRSSPRIREAFLRAASRTNGATRIEAVEAALRMGNLRAAEGAIPWDDIGVRLLNATLTEELRDIVLEAGISAEQIQPAGLNIRFDIRNPLALEAADAHAADLITGISDHTRQGIRTAILNAIVDGRPPAVSAREIRDQIGLLPRQVSALEKVRDVLEDEGKTEEFIERRMAREVRRALNERAETIARQETIWAANAGQQALWQEAAQARLIDPATARREFVVTPDDRLCPICRPLDGRRYGLFEPVVTELGVTLHPPIHVNCRCVMVLVP